MSEKTIPFESLHFSEAILMQYIFASGWSLKADSDGNLFVAQPIKLRRRNLGKYKSVIAWIRTRPDKTLTP